MNNHSCRKAEEEGWTKPSMDVVLGVPRKAFKIVKPKGLSF